MFASAFLEHQAHSSPYRACCHNVQLVKVKATDSRGSGLKATYLLQVQKGVLIEFMSQQSNVAVHEQFIQS